MSNNTFSIPNKYSDMDSFLKNNKKEIMIHVFKCFKSHTNKDFNIDSAKITIFNFENTNLVVVVKHEHYEKVLKNLLDYMSNIEEYEICSFINKIINNISS